MDQNKCRELTSDILKDLFKDVDAILFDCDGILRLFLLLKTMRLRIVIKYTEISKKIINSVDICECRS